MNLGAYRAGIRSGDSMLVKWRPGQEWVEICKVGCIDWLRTWSFESWSIKTVHQQNRWVCVKFCNRLVSLIKPGIFKKFTGCVTIILTIQYRTYFTQTTEGIETLSDIWIIPILGLALLMHQDSPRFVKGWETLYRNDPLRIGVTIVVKRITNKNGGVI
jgi:hypothetical protein